MTKNFDDFFNKYKTDLADDQIGIENLVGSNNLKPVAASPIQAGLQKVEQAGGSLLTNTVKGVSAIGQSIMGVFDFLENNQAAYDQLYGKQDDGSYDDKAGKFHWDKVGSFVGQAIGAGLSQGERMIQSKNLTELGQNTYTGVDLLKNLPGAAGEFYRDQSSQSAKIATSIAGFGLEVLFDPTAKIAGAAYKGANLAAEAGVKAGVLGERAGDVLGRAAANAATGNWVGGAIAMGAREGSFAAREKLVSFANKAYGTRRGKAAETILEWAMGPNSLTTNAEMRTTLAKYAALKEDLPKEMLKVANTTATVVSHLPTKQRTEAQKLFGQLAGASSQEVEDTALDALTKLGIRRQEAASIGSAYRAANLRLMDIIQTASKDIPGVGEISANMSEYHVRRSYRMFVDPRVKDDWLDHLVKQNTQGSWQLKNTGLRNQLMEGLGITEVAVPKIDMSFAADVKNQGDVVGGFDTFQPKTAFNKNPSAERQAALELEIIKVDDKIKSAAPGTDVSAHIRVKERLTQQVESLDKMTAGLGPNSFATPKIQKLQQQIDMLDNAINTSAEKNLDSLTSRRNNLQAKLENEINNSAFAQNTGNPALRATERRSAADLSTIDNIQSQWVDGTLQGTKAPTFNNPSTIVDPSATIKPGFSAEDAFPSMKQELSESGDIMYLPTAAKITKEHRLQYIDDLQKYIAENDGVQQSSLVGFRKGENGEVLADFAERRQTAKNTTLADIHDWTADWAAAKGISEDEIGKLNAAVSNSLTYVPGSKEFVSMVREKGQALNDLDPQLRQIIESEIGLSKVDTSAMSERTLDPIWRDLFGEIDNFSVNAAQQGVAIGEVAAKARMLSELRQRGLVVTDQELANNPELNNLGGWVSMNNIFAKEGDTASYYMQRTNQRSLEAIDRSLGDMNNMKFLTTASNLFRRAALGTDPSAHVTQFLGNISMLQMMGMRKLFGNDVNLVKGMNQAFKSVMLSDDSFKDAVDAGVMVSQTVLSEQQSAALSRALLGLPKYADGANGDKVGAMTQIYRIAQDIYGAGATKKDQIARAGVKLVAEGTRLLPGLREGTQGLDAAAQFTSSTAMFQLSDQMTRMFAYRSALADKTQGLIKANPILANFTQDSGTRINWAALEEHTASLQNAANRPANLATPSVADLKEAHMKLREEAAAVANDVALNYSDVPLAINYLSKTGVVPFIKFQYKATGRIMQFMDEKPWAFSPYYAAQRNLNDGLNPDPDNFEQQRMALSPTVRDAMVIPTGQRDSAGRLEFIDLSRWLPFGMYASAANGGGSEGGLSVQPSSIVSTPILDLVHSFMDSESQKEPGQSMASYMAQKLAETFTPAGVGPGSRKVETLANAIQQSMQYVDADGAVVNRNPSPLEQALVGYASLPEQAGQALTVAGNKMMGNDTLTSAMGTPKPQTANRPRTTVDQAVARYAVPGIGFSSDPQKTAVEYDKRYDIREQELTRLRNSIISNAGSNITPTQIDQVKRINDQIDTLNMQRMNKGASLLLGE